MGYLIHAEHYAKNRSSLGGLLGGLLFFGPPHINLNTAKYPRRNMGKKLSKNGSREGIHFFFFKRDEDVVEIDGRKYMEMKCFRARFTLFKRIIQESRSSSSWLVRTRWVCLSLSLCLSVSVSVCLCLSLSL